MNGKEIVESRMDRYGPPEETWSLIAGLWSAYLGIPITTRQALFMMVLLKSARMRKAFDQDSQDDLDGYLEIIKAVESKEPEVQYGNQTVSIPFNTTIAVPLNT